MKRITRRDKMKIYGDLLSILRAESRSSERVVLTRVQAKLNVPYDRLKYYISDLENLDLIEDQDSFKLTPKGVQYLKEYATILDFMERMGIAYRLNQ
jgi:predicted transcriptional regulator